MSQKYWRPHGLSAAARRAGIVALLGVLPAAMVIGVVAVSINKSTFLYDYRGDLFSAGQAIRASRDPYRPDLLARKATAKRAGEVPDARFAVPVYPAPALLPAVPLSLLPYRLSALLFLLGSVGCLILALRLLEVKDWRCVGTAIVSFPVLHGLTLGALDPVLMLGMAAAWRWRDHIWRSAVAVALVVAAKLFAWPLAIWLLVTRRWRASVLSLVLAFGLIIGAWAAIGFSGLLSYPKMLRDLAYVEGDAGISLQGAFHSAGVPSAVARLGVLLVAGALLVGAWWLADRSDGDRRAFALVVVAALIASPVEWTQYLALLFVPIALLSPTLSAVWFVPLITYLAPYAQQNGRFDRIVPYLIVELTVVAYVVFPRRLLRRRSVPAPDFAA